MDYEARIVKLETEQATTRELLADLKQEMHRIDGKMDAHREQSDRQFTELRDRGDRQFAELRAEQVQLRRDLEKLIYWVAGLTFVNIATMIGFALKIAEIF